MNITTVDNESQSPKHCFWTSPRILKEFRPENKLRGDEPRYLSNIANPFIKGVRLPNFKTTRLFKVF